MKQGTTLFLKLAVILMGVPVLALCILGLPRLANNPVNPSYAHLLYPILIGMYAAAIPFYIALYQAFKILGYIDKKNAFSESSVKALKIIKYCAITISTLYVVVLPFFYLVAEKDDAPGLIIIGMVPIFASTVITKSPFGITNDCLKSLIISVMLPYLLLTSLSIHFNTISFMLFGI